MVDRRLTTLLVCALLAFVALPREAHAWIENHVLQNETRVELRRTGEASVEHRITLKTNGNQRLRRYQFRVADRDAKFANDSYVVPARDALSSKLDSAVPLELSLHKPRSADDELDRPMVLRLKVVDRMGLRRGTYVLVVRYETNLRERGLLTRDGSLVRLRYDGPIFDDGFDNARTVFVIPGAATAPRAVDEGESSDAAEDPTRVEPIYLSELRRGKSNDELELTRTYAPEGESIPWVIRVDQRALDPLPRTEVPSVAAPLEPIVVTFQRPIARAWLMAAAGLLFILYALLVLLKERQLVRQLRDVGGELPSLIPLAVVPRAVLASAALVAGVALQLLLDRPMWGASLVVLATVLVSYGTPRFNPKQVMRGPGRWLAVSETEGLPVIGRRTGMSFDLTTRLGRSLFLLLLTGVGFAVHALWADTPHHALLVAFDSVAILAIFGNAPLSSLPPDMAVEPSRFLRKLVARLRKIGVGSDVRLVPRIRIPNESVDPDELRLAVVPRIPLRGFNAIEVGLNYAMGPGARVAMPEVLFRFTEGTPCDEAVAGLSRYGRTTPGRKPGERVIAISPRFPTVRMTAEIVAALAMRVVDQEALQAEAERVAGQASETEPANKAA